VLSPITGVELSCELPLANEVKVTFMDGAKVSIEGSTKPITTSASKDADTGVVEYDTNITPGMFCCRESEVLRAWNIRRA